MRPNIYSKFKRIISNFPGWKINRKIIVFESDDWGSIRMPSSAVYNKLLQKGIKVDKLCYNKYDSLASKEDLESLFEVLSSFRDRNGNNPIITANTIVANPDFDKIYQSDFSEYFYEPFTETLNRYPNHFTSFQLWREGIKQKIFYPQFHGREHLNVIRWMKSLRNNIGNVRLAFDNKLFDLSDSLEIGENSYMDTFNFESTKELEFQKKAIVEGLNLFERIFGYRSKTFIAPNYIWSSKLNKILYENGVMGIQGNWFQFQPIPGNQHKFDKKFHYTGQKNNLGQIYLVRNAAFEPSCNPNFDYVTDVMQRLDFIFKSKKPAIIGSHRLNFIGFLEPKNRDKNLKVFKGLLETILKVYPDIEFLSSDQLLDEIIKNK